MHVISHRVVPNAVFYRGPAVYLSDRANVGFLADSICIPHVDFSEYLAFARCSSRQSLGCLALLKVMTSSIKVTVIDSIKFFYQG